MKVSIATICLNQAAFVAQAIESVLAQDHGDIEYIVIDAGSTDGSRDAIDPYRDRIDRVLFEPDDGPADGLNKALHMARGEIWAYVNADDLLLPHSVSMAAQEFEVDSSLDVVYGDGIVVDRNRRVVRRERSDKFGLRRYAYGIGIVVQQSTFIRRSAVLEVGGYNVLNRTCWDGELLLELALNGAQMRHVHEAWGVFRLHADSITGSQRAAKRYEADRQRLFERAVGRRWRGPDAAVVAGGRAFKALKNLGRTRKIPDQVDSHSRLAMGGRTQ
jgi:glycosyltransferase involved in cell wall biosynthesis